MLVACAVAALVVANSGWATAYHDLWATTIGIGAGGHVCRLTLHQWINDGLMAIFFLLVGLEIKREALVGELASPRQAALPIAARDRRDDRAGGDLSALASGGGAAARGWAIPMATDIAFALGVLAMVAPRAPSGLKVFLAALAIVDDIGAVLVIALFYTGDITWHAVEMAGVCLRAARRAEPSRRATADAVSRCRPRALVLRARIRDPRDGRGRPARVGDSAGHADQRGRVLGQSAPSARRIRSYRDRRSRVLTSKGQQDAIFGLERASEQATAPLLRLEHGLHGFSAFVVMPLFAFSNAGVTLSGCRVDRVTLAVVLGLAIGKPLGIMAAALAGRPTRLAALPQGVSWMALHGCAWLGGIGFTMSLFIATLAFEGTPLLDSAKIGILGALASPASSVRWSCGRDSELEHHANRQRPARAGARRRCERGGPGRHGRQPRRCGP